MLLQLRPLHAAFCWQWQRAARLWQYTARLWLSRGVPEPPSPPVSRPPSPLTPRLLSLPVFLSVNNLPQTPSTFTITTCHILRPTTEITTVTPR